MSEDSWTPLTLLKVTTDYFQKQAVAEARLDAELLLAKVLGVERIRLYTDFDRPLAAGQVDRYRALVKQRAAGRPAKYIIGATEFFSIELAVDERVLIPRPETELLVERALSILKARRAEEFALVVDLCTGSGAVAIALAKNYTSSGYIAIDLSAGALEVARANAEANGVCEKIEFLHGDLLDPLVTMGLEGKVDAIVTNPPYVSADEWNGLPREIREYEPREALVGGERGTEIEVRIIDQAHGFLRGGGALLMEMDPSQAKVLAEAAARHGGYSAAVFHEDYSRRVRVVELEKKIPPA